MCKASEPNAMIIVNKYVCWTQVAVDDPVAVQTTECGCYRSRELKTGLEIEGPSDVLLENVAARIS
jgi:hypothetical protein